MGHNRTYRVVNGVFAALYRVMGYRFDVRGAEHLPAEGPAVVASNHTGFLDFTFVGYVARQRGRFVRFMCKQDIFDLPLVGAAMRAMGHVPVTRSTGARAYRRALHLVEAGEVVGVFPEATISRSWRLKPFRPGAAGLAVLHSAPVVPAAVWGGHRVLTVDGHRSLRRRIPITISLGEPLAAHPGESLDAFTERLHAAMRALLDDAVDTYPEQPRDDADRWWLPHDRGGSAPDPATAARLDREALAAIGEDFDERVA